MNAGSLMNMPLLALAISAFAIGTAEFVVMGLLPEIAGDMAISIPDSGHLVSGYALGVVIGGPVVGMAIRSAREKSALIALMLMFVAGNAGCLLAPGFGWLMLARVFTALSHASFIGTAAVLASRLAPPGKEAQAMVLMLSGMTLANVLGVPLGSLLGQLHGWRATFLAVMLLGLLAAALIAGFVPAGRGSPSAVAGVGSDMRRPVVWLGLATSVMASASMFAFFTYIVPVLLQVTHVEAKVATAALFVCGIGITIGGLLGGRLADWNLTKALTRTLPCLIAVLIAFYWASASLYPALACMALWGGLSFAVGMMLQALIIRVAGNAAGYASTLNIGAFNLGNAIGAWLGGRVIETGWAFNAITLLAAALAAVTLAMVVAVLRTARRAPRPLLV